MTNDASAPIQGVREVAPNDWGRVLLEELLFQAAEAISARGADTGNVTLSLPFTITANQYEKCLEISTPGKVEQAIVTRVPLRF